MGQVAAAAAEVVAVEAKTRDSWDRNSLSKSGQAGCVEGLSTFALVFLSCLLFPT